MQKFLLEFLRPRLEEVEQGAGVTHLLSRKGKIVDRHVRIGDAPFLKVRVEDGQQRLPR